MLILNRTIWLVLALLFDNGAFAKKLDGSTRRSHQDSNDPRPDLDQIYASKIKTFGEDIYRNPHPFQNDFRLRPQHIPTIPPDQETFTDKLNDFYLSALTTWNRFTGSSSPSQRAYRNADDKAMFVNHTSIVAHMVNGIYLQSGLMEGTIPIDALVAELLKFGSVKVEDVVKFESNKVTALTEKLKQVNTDLKAANSEAIQLEELAIKWNKMRVDYESAGNFEKIQGADAYFTAVDKLSKNFPDDLGALGGSIESLIKEMTKLEASVSEDVKIARVQDDIKHSIENLGKISNEIDQAKIKFDAAVTKLNAETSLKAGEEVFKPLKAIIDLMRNREGNNMKSQPDPQTVKANIGIVVDPVAHFTSASQQLQVIGELVKGRQELVAGKFSYGFPNGNSDLEQLSKDVLDMWLGSILNVEKSKLHSLVDGYEPLSRVSVQLNGIDGQLQPISSASVHQSLQQLNEIGTLVTRMPSDSVDSVSALKGYYDCDHSSVGKYQEAETFVTNVYAFSRFYADLDNAVKFDLSPLKKEIGNFVTSLDSIKDVQAKANDLKNTNKLQKLKDSADKVQKFFEGVNVAKIKSTVLPALATGKSSIDQKSRFMDAVAIEKKTHECLKKLAANGEKLAQAAQVIQKLRNMDVSQFDSVNLAASTVSQISKDLSETNSIPDTMKKGAKEVSKAINAFPDSGQQSGIIGQSARSLESAYKLKDQATSFAQLRTVGSIVTAEIQKIPSLNDRKSIETLWGDHNKDMGQLEEAVKKIDAFDANLDASKLTTMTDHAGPLQNLVELPDVTINVKNKLDALDALIKTADATTKPKLEEAKKSLDALSTLDLEFSKHSTQFQNAPSAFEAFEIFLTAFLSTEHKEPATVGGFTVTHIILIVAVIIVVGLLAFGGRYAYVRHMIKKRIKEWILKQAFQSEEQAVSVLRTCMMVVEVVAKADLVASQKLIPKDEHRYHNIGCNPKTMVRFKRKDNIEVRLHANLVESPKTGLTKYIASQAPINETIERFWYMILHYKCEYIVMLCKWMEPAKDSIELEVKCSTYFDATKMNEPVTHGSVEVTVVAQEHIMDNKVIKTTIKVVDKSNEYESETITHYNYVVWPDHGVPNGHEDLYNLMELVNNKSKAPVVVHCSAGVGRTMAFIGTDFISEAVQLNPKIALSETFNLLRNMRWCGIQNIVQLHWTLLGVIFRLSKLFKLGMSYYASQLAFFDANIKDIFKKKDDGKETKDGATGGTKKTGGTKAPAASRQAAAGEGSDLSEESESDSPQQSESESSQQHESVSSQQSGSDSSQQRESDSLQQSGSDSSGQSGSDSSEESQSYVRDGSVSIVIE